MVYFILLYFLKLLIICLMFDFLIAFNVQSEYYVLNMTG